MFQQGQIEPARLHFLAALIAEPNHVHALQNLGAVLRTMQHYEAAAVVSRRSVALAPGNAYCRSNLGVSLLNLRRFDEALALLRAVTVDMPDHGPSWHNLGLALYIMGRHEAALKAFDRALTLLPDLQTISDRALTLLALGEIQKGLEAYEVRWAILPKSKVWGLNIAEWQGEDLKGKHLLVHHEQGFGDSIMLVRFVRQLAEAGARITLAVPSELLRLFKRSFPFVAVVDFNDEEKLSASANFDFHSPLLSVMRWLGIQQPQTIDSRPYLVTMPTPHKLPEADFRIGICWASGKHGKAVEDRRRLVPLTLFLPMLECPGVSLVSLQKGDEVRDIPLSGSESIVFDLSNRLEDFAATADLMNDLDLVISVDSAVAHLAGAIGKPCLMLSPYTRCWRWWRKNLGWPWYTNMFVFSQSEDGTWTKPMRNVVRAVMHDIRVVEKIKWVG
jgi:tetratricopeptide (TPR) repeat protein